MRIIVNADDFGLSVDTVHATITAICAGHVTSATLMPNAPASAEAIDFARATPSISFGVHLTFGGEGSDRAIAAASDVPSLVDRAGRLPRNTNLIRLRAVLGRLSVTEIEREIVAQVEWMQSRGAEVSHVDSHQHLHKYPPFRKALAEALPKVGVRRVRNVQDLYLRRPLASPTVLLGSRWRAQLMRAFATTEHFYMPASTGDSSWAAVLHLPLLEDSTLEVGVHPGGREEWRQREAEGAATFAREAVADGHSLINWFDI